MTRVVLPETFLRCVKPEDREKLKLGLTAQEFMAKGAAANEKALQRQIVSLLRLKGIEPLVPTFGKKTRMTSGWPDITFAVAVPRTYNCNCWKIPTVTHLSCLWELKHGDGKLTREQQQMHIRLSSPPNGWRVCVIHSVDEAIAELRSLGIE